MAQTTLELNEDRFIEVDHAQVFKYGQKVAGDIFTSEKTDGGNRIILVLSDGLGSGIKASVLATLTATMASRFVINYRDLQSIARMIMTTLPVCSQRRISYATFTIVDIDTVGATRIIEYGNPSFILMRENLPVKIEKKIEEIYLNDKELRTIHYSEFDVKFGDRIIFCSDGVTQAGMGEKLTPFGWEEDNLRSFITTELNSTPRISARQLAQRIVKKALEFDSNKAKDDITCAVIYLRKPRKTLIVSGPPIKQEKDPLLAKKIEDFNGNKIICGGTTANIVAREWDKKITVNMDAIDPEIPPYSAMPGVSLISEGILTLCKVSEVLDKDLPWDELNGNAAGKILDFLAESDIIHFLVGTKINEVHQDPNMPVEIEIRRTIIKKIKQLLEKKYLKQVTLEYI